MATQAATQTVWFAANVDPTAARAERAIGLARSADRLGYDLVGVQDHPYNPAFLETWTFLTAIGVQTRHARLFTNVASLPLRPPAMLAKSAATLDRLTGGRVELGLGAGAFWDGIAGYGGPRRTPGEAVEALAEAVEVVRRLWLVPTGDRPVSFEGRHYSVAAQPGPAPARSIPIWLGALGPRMLRLTGTVADGWIVSTTYVEPTDIPGHRRLIDEAAAAAGRDPAAVRRGYNVMGSVVPAGQTRLSARHKGVQIDTAEAWAETLTRYVADLGLDTFVYWPVAGDTSEQFRLFLHEVAPRVREALGQPLAPPPQEAADAVEEASMESFPASDAPAFIRDRS